MTKELPKEIYENLLKKYQEDLKKAKSEKERTKIGLKISFVRKKLGLKP